MAKKIVEVTEPALTLNMENQTVRVYVLNTENHRCKKATRHEEYWYGPSIITVTHSSIGSTTEIEEWPDAPSLWPWLQALAQIGAWALPQAPDELKTYWKKSQD